LLHGLSLTTPTVVNDPGNGESVIEPFFANFWRALLPT
jgi:hypothetical protein